MRRKFKRQCFWLKKLGEKWRRPKGRHSKLRHEKKGRWAVPKVGYGKPKSMKGMIMFKGRLVEPVMVNNAKDLEKIDPKIQVAVLSSSIGKKKSAAIMEIAIQKGISIANRKIKKTKNETKSEGVKESEKQESGKK